MYYNNYYEAPISNHQKSRCFLDETTMEDKITMERCLGIIRKLEGMTKEAKKPKDLEQMLTQTFEEIGT